jgi:FdhE protein
MVRASPGLKAAADLQREVMAHGARHAPRVAPLAQDAAADEARLSAGVPLLHERPWAIDLRRIQELYLRLADLAARRSEQREALKRLRRSIDRREVDFAALLAAGATGDAERLPTFADRWALPPRLLQTLSQLALAPSLRQLSAPLAPLVARAWRHGYCPLCAAWPVLAELRGLEQDRYLRCGLCAASWAVPRLFCPFCGNGEHRSLGYLEIEGERRCRVETCEDCRGYVKTLATFDAIPADLLPIEDLATVHLDFAAMEQDYARPATPGFPLELRLQSL